MGKDLNSHVNNALLLQYILHSSTFIWLFNIALDSFVVDSLGIEPKRVTESCLAGRVHRKQK
jgi:hypothetical protein